MPPKDRFLFGLLTSDDSSVATSFNGEKVVPLYCVQRFSLLLNGELNRRHIKFLSIGMKQRRRSQLFTVMYGLVCSHRRSKVARAEHGRDRCHFESVCDVIVTGLSVRQFQLKRLLIFQQVLNVRNAVQTGH